MSRYLCEAGVHEGEVEKVKASRWVYSMYEMEVKSIDGNGLGDPTVDGDHLGRHDDSFRFRQRTSVTVPTSQQYLFEIWHIVALYRSVFVLEARSRIEANALWLLSFDLRCFHNHNKIKWFVVTNIRLREAD